MGIRLIILWIYLQGIGHFEVMQQPEGCYWCVTEEPNAVTQLYLAKAYGFVSHNYLAGNMFNWLRLYDIISISFDGEEYIRYQVTGIKEYRVIGDHYLYEDLDTGKLYSDVEVFKMIYDLPNTVVLQTCLERDGNEKWGRLFIIATPYRERINVE